jgi:hypothetical protein
MATVSCVVDGCTSPAQWIRTPTAKPHLPLHVCRDHLEGMHHDRWLVTILYEPMGAQVDLGRSAGHAGPEAAEDVTDESRHRRLLDTAWQIIQSSQELRDSASGRIEEAESAVMFSERSIASSKDLLQSRASLLCVLSDR